MSALERPVVKPRPVYLNLVAIRLPLPGIVSILHRVSGAAAVPVRIPLLLAGVGASLASAESFAALKAASRPIRSPSSCCSGFAWAYLHHFCAGIRYLLLDLHIGDRARAGAAVERSSCWW